MPTLIQKRSALLAEAKYLGAKAEGEGRDLSDEEVTRVDKIKGEVATLTEKIDRDEGTRNAVKGAFKDDVTSEEDGKGGRGNGSKSRAVESDMARAMTRAITDNYRSTKAVTTSAGSISVPSNLGIVPALRHPHLLSNIVPVVPQESGADGGPSSVSYLQQTGRTNAATTVARSAEKPESDLAFTRIANTFATVAHVIRVPAQWLEDGGPKFQQVIEQELLYGLALGLDDLILNGGTDEDGGTLTGLLGTSGVSQTAFLESPLRTIRRGIGTLEASGVGATHVALTARDWEDIDVATYEDGKYILPSRPVGDGLERRLWDTPLARVEALTEGTAVVGDFSSASIGLVSRGPVTLQWNPYSLDTTNQVILRVEGRFAPVVLRPAAFAVADLTAV